MARNTEIYRVTVVGGLANVVLVAVKLVCGILGASAAMIADAVHSLSDLATDAVVLVFVRLSSRPADADHHYGHGKYETLASLLIGVALLLVAVVLLRDAAVSIAAAMRGEALTVPGWPALVAAVVSIVIKEAVYRMTAAVGRRTHSEAVVANAWHHRSDALSSVGTGLGIGGAMALGPSWAVLDPLAAAVVSVFIAMAAVRVLLQAVGELLEKSLPPEVEDEIRRIVAEDPDVRELHHLRTRAVGSVYSIDMHLRMPGSTTLTVAHRHATALERRLRDRFGDETMISLHLEPLKVNGSYE